MPAEARDVRCSAAGVIGRCVPCGCWESNFGPLKEHYVFLTAEPLLQLVGVFIGRHIDAGHYLED